MVRRGEVWGGYTSGMKSESDIISCIFSARCNTERGIASSSSVRQ